MPTTNPKRGFTRMARMFGGSLLGLSLCTGLLVAVSAAPTGAGAASAPITLYSGQHVQTTQALVNAFEKKTGITVNVRFDDEDVLADQTRDRGDPLAGRRVLHRELAAAAVPGLQAPAGPGQAVDPGTDPVEVQLAQRNVGRRLGPGQRHGLQHLPAQSSPSCRLRPCSWPSPSGRGRSPWRAARPTSSPSSPPWRAPTAARPRSGGSRRSRPTPAATSTLTTRRSSTRSTGARSPSASSTSTTGTAMRAEVGLAERALGHRLLRPARRRLRHRRLGSRRPAVVPAPGGGAAVRRLPRLGAGAADHRPQRQLRVPDRVGGDDGAARDARSTSSSPTRITIAQLGTGAQAIKLLQEAQLL